MSSQTIQIQTNHIFALSPSTERFHLFDRLSKKMPKINESFLGQIWLILNSPVNQKETTSDAVRGGEYK